MTKFIFRLIPLLMLFLSLGVAPLAAQQSYDRFAPVYSGAAEPASKSQFLNDFLTYPFELIRWPVSRSLVYIEKHHVDKKVQYYYDTLQNWGISPDLGFTGGGSLGMDVDLIRLAHQKTNLPDVRAKTWIHYANDTQFLVGAELGWLDQTDTGLGFVGVVEYDDRPEEHFYGIGPNSSAGNGTSFNMETTKLGAKFSYDPNPTIGASIGAFYRNINITNGEDGGRGIIDRIFPAGSVPGLGGDEILSLETEIKHDTRNHRTLSTEGGLQRIGFGYHEGVGGSDARYFKYEAEASHYLSLGSKRRVLALHFFGEHNDELNGGYVPFHQMAKLGGFGARPRLSHTLRSYDFNRFFDESAVLFNIEYRYTVWEYREFKMDAVFFWDEGQVFGELSSFRTKNFKESYGTGFRISVANHMLFDVEMAHGDEGTNIYVKTKAPF